VIRSNPYGQRNDGGWCDCAECGRVYGGLSGFDLHRMDQARDPYDWRCATEAELQAKGLSLSAKGWWVRQDARSSRRLSTQTVPAAKGG
jgi:hypothetical protein